MQRDQSKTPLYTQLKQFKNQKPLSFHVPGHKNGRIFAPNACQDFQEILPLDLTELSGLDDLHAPNGVIQSAEELASAFFRVDYTHFLIGGSTAGNLAMILSVCSSGDKVIVQRNSHKSIFNALELSGALPVFVAPEFDREARRLTAPNTATVQTALDNHPDAKALVLTYPDYFGKTFPLHEMISRAHARQIPVLIDEAHGVHFSLHKDLPASAVALGADAVVQSAHKMAPAMTMGAYLHVQSAHLSNAAIQYYLQMIQSSSPSYPVMASLDLARFFLADLTNDDWDDIHTSCYHVKQLLAESSHWEVASGDDPLKLILQAKRGLTGYQIAQLFEQFDIYPELATHKQVLFIHGLAPFTDYERLNNAINYINAELKNTASHDIMEKDEIDNLMTERVTELAIDYAAMKQRSTQTVPLSQASGCIAAEPITPYPPGIPFILKGTRITHGHIHVLYQLLQQGVHLQPQTIDKGISVFH
ncbi:aminotransferase class I/II-fold pyridoxal phosphate-dependent enzyme [Barrientosiimonas marina]|uniref:Aminotransferase class I/II-fold pyridoxal phosphate-dependent enzyme n=1 Tax=Lentibacillus kimchii TaxID=1542911 RepID=A0ABW2URW6_9BACI